MLYSQQIIVKRWIPILKEYERTKAKVTPRQFKFIKDLCAAHHISRKELSRCYRKWVEGNRQPEALLPMKRGARPGSRRTPKPIERNIMNAKTSLGVRPTHCTLKNHLGEPKGKAKYAVLYGELIALHFKISLLRLEY